MKNHIQRILSSIGFSLPKTTKPIGTYLQASQLCAVNILGQIDSATNGNFDKVLKCVILGGFVNSESNFSDHPFVINGASDLFYKIFKKKGKHTRFAVGVNSLPLNASVEIDAIFSLK